MRRAWIKLAGLYIALCTCGAAAEGGLHVVFVTDCSSQSDWMSEALIYSHFQSNTSGGITRVSACPDPNYDFPKSWHPSFSLQ
eukprot:scaffold176682_cov39-Prasinocladus_malaysianus.AAC.1